MDDSLMGQAVMCMFEGFQGPVLYPTAMYFLSETGGSPAIAPPTPPGYGAGGQAAVDEEPTWVARPVVVPNPWAGTRAS
jgi:hypothetical protein